MKVNYQCDRVSCLEYEAETLPPVGSWVSLHFDYRGRNGKAPIITVVLDEGHVATPAEGEKNDIHR